MLWLINLKKKELFMVDKFEKEKNYLWLINLEKRKKYFMVEKGKERIGSHYKFE